MSRSPAEIVREYGPFPGADSVHGVTYDGQNVWFAAGDTLNAFDPASGTMLRSFDVAARAGTAFDGQHLFQLAGDRIQKIDPKTGRVLATIPAPGGGGDSGLTWAEGTLRGDSSHDRVQPLRHRGHLGRRRAVARHLGRRRERTAAGRCGQRHGARDAGTAARRRRFGTRSERRRLLLRRRQQREGAPDPPRGLSGADVDRRRNVLRADVS